jgi:hypothetical protein
MTQRLSDKHPEEFIQVSFDYTKDLAVGETLTAATQVITVTVADGVDGNPSAVLNGASAIVGAFVVQPVKLGLDNVDYHFKCICTTSNGNKFVVQAILPVRKKTSPR